MRLSELVRIATSAFAKHGDMDTVFLTKDDAFDLETTEVFHIHQDPAKPLLFGITNEEEMP